MLEEEQIVKAWLVTIKSWPGLRTIVLAKSRHQARWQQWKSCNEVGYEIPYIYFVAVRSPQYDRPSKTVPKSIGWTDGREKSGCLVESDK